MNNQTKQASIRAGRGLVLAARWSWQGLKAAWSCESSFRTEVLCTVILIPIAVYFGHSGLERATLIASLLLVLAMELANSAIETVIERFGPEQHYLAGRAKDMGSAAVFVLLLNVIVCWTCILLPHFVH